MSTKREDRRYFRNEIDRNLGRFDPNVDLAAGARRDPDRDYIRDYNLGTGTSMRGFRDRKESALFAENNSDLNHRGFFGKGPKGWRRSDERIRDEACEALSDSWDVDASQIEVEVKDGCVYLRGTVDSRNSKREAERAVEDLLGVTDVRNELNVKAPDIFPDHHRSPGVSEGPERAQ